jgi:hypothetical protein
LQLIGTATTKHPKHFSPMQRLVIILISCLALSSCGIPASLGRSVSRVFTSAADITNAAADAVSF